MKSILLISTGGTIASTNTDSGLTPTLTPAELLNRVPEAASLCQITTLSLLNLDSTNILPQHWLLLSAAIEKHYDEYDGFVICHGTDTLAYTAAALSYLIQGTHKPIVLTGAQRSMDEADTDARQNLLDSLRVACGGSCGICVVFGGHVIAGTRARKMRTKSYNAFSSLNFPDLARMHNGRILRYIPFGDGEAQPRFYHRLDTAVMLLKLIPGLSPQAFHAAGALCRGLILESYGVGGVPEIYLPALDDLIQKGKTIIMATQVPQEGSDLSVYQVGHVVKERYNLLETYDMTLEATVTKLMWALGQTDNPEEFRKLFTKTINYDLLF